MIVLGYSGFARSPAEPRPSPLISGKNAFEEAFQFRHGEVPLPWFPLGFFGHDGAAALVVDGEVVAAAAEERFVRVKHGLNLGGRTLLPGNAVQFCLERAGIGLEEVDRIAHYCDFRPESIEGRLTAIAPYLSGPDRERVRESYCSIYESMLCPGAVREQFERMTGHRPAIIQPVPHHLAHAAGAYYASGWREALTLTLDGTGELESSLLAAGRDGQIEVIDSTPLPTSLGTLYLLLTVFLGFRSLGDEFKVMGLAAYGNPNTYRRFFDSLIRLGEDGRYDTCDIAAPGFRDRLLVSLGPPRSHGGVLTDRHADIAAALQACVVRSVLHRLRHARETIGLRRLCLSGGVALNCVLNGAIARSGLFDEIFIQPAAGDEGCSAGAALLTFHRGQEATEYQPIGWDHAYLGPDYTEREILTALKHHGKRLRWRRSDDLASEVAGELAHGKTVGWFQGRMEFGPRALGNRSILADPRDEAMKDRVNRQVKWREPFRPFAPAVLEEAAADWFDMGSLRNSPFMLFTVPVRSGDRLPAVTHVDGSARVQTVARQTNAIFHELIREFGVQTGIPVLLNTSFNVQNEPIVCSPEDAVRCFLKTDLDLLVLGNFVARKHGTS